MVGAYAQRFEVEESNKSIKLRIGEQASTALKIKNLTDQTLNIVIRRVNQTIGSTQKSFFCYDGNCFESDVEQLPVQYSIPAGETSLKFESILDAGLAAGYSKVKYLIYDRNHPSEAIEYEINYTIEEEQDELALYDSDDLKIHDVYPNPASEFAVVHYSLDNREVEAKVVIHNVLGSIVGEYKLPYLENKVTIKTDNFNAGVYFYTLYLDNDGVMTRKLIIRK